MSRTAKLFSILLGIFALIVVGNMLFEQKVRTLKVPQSDDHIQAVAPGGEPVAGITAPQGFKLSVYAKGVKGARVIEFLTDRSMLVTETGEGKIAFIRDSDNDGIADEVKTVAEGLTNPHGMHVECDGGSCWLFVAESDALDRFEVDPNTGMLTNEEKLVDLPYSRTDRHFTRSLLSLSYQEDFPHEFLISVGSTCNVCFEENKQHGSILLYDSSTRKLSEYATGLRNAVFMTQNEHDGSVWATEMGRDALGDDIPPDEINRIEKGINYGWPICYGAKIHDAQFDKRQYFRDPCADTAAPSIELPAHSAPLGLSFVPQEGWPEEYVGDLLVAYHGSWNRSIPTGYKIVRIDMDAENRPIRTEDFLTGWLTEKGVKLGRPVDVKALPGGIVYVSDDETGVIYRLVRTE